MKENKESKQTTSFRTSNILNSLEKQQLIENGYRKRESWVYFRLTKTNLRMLQGDRENEETVMLYTEQLCCVSNDFATYWLIRSECYTVVAAWSRFPRKTLRSFSVDPKPSQHSLFLNLFSISCCFSNEFKIFQVLIEGLCFEYFSFNVTSDD